MKVLLDENMPHALRPCLPGHEVVTAAYAGWAGVQNGDLLTLAEEAGFNVLVTGDSNLSYQQNIAARRIVLVLVTDQRWFVLKEHLDGIVAAVDRALPGSFEVVMCRPEL